nr:uncharacterized protein LOC119186070 [Rhipicephalus microplus]
MPAISEHTLYLVGYSSTLYIRNVECVISTFLGRQGDWVRRSIIYMFAIRQKPWNGQTSAFKVKWPQYSALLYLNGPDDIKRDLNSKREYVVRTYDDRHLIVSDLKGLCYCTRKKKS